MPNKNTTKRYTENGYYHIYNRGVEKRTIFLDSQDYNVFLSYLQEYLCPRQTEELQKKLVDPSLSWQEKSQIRKILSLNNFSDEITMLAYCLMPNHFHFLIKQKSAGAIDKFMNSLATRYVMYFNKKYKRVGSLFQDVYKAVEVVTNEELLYLSRYIHKQALGSYHLAGQDWLYSYPVYLKERQSDWVHPEEIITFFSAYNPKLTYQIFVSQKDSDRLIDRLKMEED